MVQVVVAVAAAFVSGGFAVFSFVLSRRAIARDRAQAKDDAALQYRLPLLHAAFDLQSRLYNIRRLDFLHRYDGPDNTDSDREYAVDNTLFLVAQYLCYSEIIRRGLLFLDPVDPERQRQLSNAMAGVADLMATTRRIDQRVLCLFHGEQRAVGELMQIERPGALAGAPSWDCMGYAAFVKRLHEPEVNRWFVSLRSSIEALATDVETSDDRLVALQHALLELVDLLDPCPGSHVSDGCRERL